MTAGPKKAIEVFYSYAHRDQALRDTLEKHLGNLKRQGLITGWHDRQIIPGAEWKSEINGHLDTASIILLLVSPDFLSSDYCYSVELKRAMDRHNGGEACVIPIILRPTNWEGSLFEKLQVLPSDGKPVTSWRNRDKAFLDIAQGIQKAVEKLCFTDDRGATLAIQRQYCNTLYERWKILDFKGIMHVNMHQPIRIPLEDIFVLPNLLVGIPEYETIERKDEYESEEDKVEETRRDEGWEEISGLQIAPEHPWSEEKRFNIQREDLQTALASQNRTVILGDPGSGKSTLLHYLILKLVEGKDSFAKAFPKLAEKSAFIPLYIPLASYAEHWSSSPTGERSLNAFLPRFLRDNYLESFIDFIQSQLMQGTILLLMDGLDEILDTSLRIQIVRQVEAFTQSYPLNRFIVTSRIVGYKEAQLAVEYRPYTLADFNEEQIKTFVGKWCLAYEHWVKETGEGEFLPEGTTDEAEKLFLATQRNPGVKRLAVNPLLLTILAIIQGQGVELPSHRIELFELCATTLLDTWIKAKGLVHSAHFTKKDLIKILCPLAFWMHEHLAVGVILEEDLVERIKTLLLERDITTSTSEAVKLAQKFLDTIRGRTGILVEREKQRYGFLHPTFEEFFAAKELRRRKDRDTFIKTHLHDSRWREIILLALGDVGIIQLDEKGVTELLQNGVLKAGSLFESWLHRDLLFAGLCLADDVGINAACEDEIIERILFLYITSPYDSIRVAFSNILRSWNETKIASKVTKLVLTLLYEKANLLGIKVQLPKGLSSPLKEPLVKKVLAYYQSLIEHYRDSKIQLLQLPLIALLSNPQVDTIDYGKYALAILSELAANTREEATLMLARIGSEQPTVIGSLLKLLIDSNTNVRKSAIKALGRMGNGEPLVIEALLKSATDSDLGVQQAVIEALDQIDAGQPGVIDCLFRGLLDPDTLVSMAAARALGLVGQKFPEVTDALLKKLSDSDPYMRQAAARALGKLGQGTREVIDVLLEGLSDPDRLVRQAAVKALGQLGQGQASPEIIDALLEKLSDSDPYTRQAAVKALGQLGQGQASPEIIDALLEKLSSSNRFVSLAVTGFLWQDQAEIIDALLEKLSDSDPYMRQAAVEALGRLGQGNPEVIKALNKEFGSSDLYMRQTAVKALGQIYQGKGYHVSRNALRDGLEDFLIRDGLRYGLEDDDKDVRKATAIALKQLRIVQPEQIDPLFKRLFDPDRLIRQAIVEALGQLGQGTPEVIDALLERLTDPDRSVRQTAARSLGQLGQGTPEFIDTLFKKYSDFDKGVKQTIIEVLAREDVKQTIIEVLARVGQGTPEFIDTLFKKYSDSDKSVKQTIIKVLAHVEGSPEVVDVLLRKLTGPNKDIKRMIEEGWGQGQSKLMDVLLRKLYDPDNDVRERARAASTLARILDPRLTESDQDVKRMIVEVLGEIGRAESAVMVAPLSRFSDPNKDAREAAVRALGELGKYQSTDIDALLSRLSDPDKDVREATARALEQIGQESSEVVDALLNSLSDPDYQVRWAGAEALAKMGKASSKIIDELLNRLVSPKADWKWLDNCQPIVIQCLLEKFSDAQTLFSVPSDDFLRQIGVNQSAVEYKRSLDKDVTMRLLQLLKYVGGEQLYVADFLLKILPTSNAIFRQSIIEALGEAENGNHDVIDVLLQQLTSTRVGVRRAAVESLGKVGKGNPRVIDALFKLLHDTNIDLIRLVLEGLERVGCSQEQINQALMVIQFENRNEKVRQAAKNLSIQGGIMHSLINDTSFDNTADIQSKIQERTEWKLRQASSNRLHLLEDWIEYLANECDRYSIGRKAVIRALGKVGSNYPCLQEALLTQLANGKINVKYLVIEAIGYLDSKNPVVTELLFQRLTDSNARIRHTAAEAIMSLHEDRLELSDSAERLLQQYKPTADGQVVNIQIIDELLFILQQVVGGA